MLSFMFKISPFICSICTTFYGMYFNIYVYSVVSTLHVISCAETMCMHQELMTFVVFHYHKIFTIYLKEPGSHAKGYEEYDLLGCDSV
jgi:hypothetical protein